MTTSLERTPDRPHQRTGDEILRALATDIDSGLSSSEVSRRLDDYGPNELESAEGTSIWSRVVGQFTDPLVIMLIIAMAISLAAWIYEGTGGTPYEPIVIAVILVANAALGLWQELKADNAVAALQKLTAVQATVWRDAERLTVPSAELVPGDILLLSEGDAVSADARVVKSESLRVAEASLTGESQPVSKQVEPIGDVVLADRTNMVFNGTVVTAGRGIAVVVETGMSTQMGSIASMLEESEEDPTPLQIELGRVGKVLGIVVLVLSAIVVGSVLLVSGIETPSDVIEVLLVGVSLAVAAIPEGLVAIVSIVLAIGVQRMAERNALVKKLSSVETLGSASVICTDKTGTLTRNEMTIERVITASGEVEITGSGYIPVGEAVVGDQPLLPGPLLHEVHLVLRGGSLANDASTRETEEGRWEIQGDPTEAAFLVAERKLGITDARLTRYRRIGEIPFSSERKMMTTIDEDDVEEGVVIVTKGAPDVLLDRCSHEYRSGSEVELTQERRTQILESVDGLANQALRTLAVAYRREEGIEDGIDESLIEKDLILVGVVGIIDPPRSEVRGAIDEAKRAGIRIVMITGDHPLTATRIAEDLELADVGSRTVTGAEVAAMDAESFDAATEDASVFARVAPEDKLRIVDTLKRQGHIVAMTGDGVNDAPALRRADIGVAMGITGTEVSKEASDMILTDDDFATIVAAVREGRAIFENIRKFLRYLLGSNFGEVLVVFLGVIGAGVLGLEAGVDELAVPLLATQILWINLLTDSGLALALGIDPTIDDLMADRPRKLTDRMIDSKMGRVVGLTGLTVALSALVAFDLELTGGLLDGTGDLRSARTHAFTTVVLAQIFNAYNSRSYSSSAFEQVFSNRWLTGAAMLTLSLQILVVHAPFLNEAFETAPMSLGDWAVTFALSSTVLWVEEVRKLMLRRRNHDERVG
jgi:magnesium-transporting ATPase (P-type)